MTNTISSSGLGQVSEEFANKQILLDPKTGVKTIKVGDLEFPPRSVWMKTYGCQMNYHDSERLLSHLENLNFSKVDTPEEADLVLYNTCAIRDLSNQKF